MPRVRPLAAALGLLLAGSLAPAAQAADLVEVWLAALQNDPAYAVAQATRAAAQPRREQAAALWRPSVSASASVGLSNNQTETSGAHFSAPGLGASDGVGFDTSINHGTATRWSLTAVQPLYNPQRRAAQQQLDLSVDVAELDAQAARQALMVQTAQRYFDLALAEETLRVLQRQLDSVQRASTEAQDRFKLGAAPVTDTYEAQARLAALQAQRLAAEDHLQSAREALADSAGLPAAGLSARLPDAGAADRAAAALPRTQDFWLAQSAAGNPGLRSRELAVELARREAEKTSLKASPSVDLVAQVGRDHLGGSGDYGSAGNTASNRMIGVQLSVPLFTGGYRSAQHDEALRGIDKARAEAALARQQLAQQVRSTWRGLRVGAERVKALDQALQASVARADATQLGHDVGDRTTLDLLNAENDGAQARLALAQGRVELLLDRLRLSALAGQLDLDTLRAVNTQLSPP